MIDITLGMLAILLGVALFLIAIHRIEGSTYRFRMYLALAIMLTLVAAELADASSGENWWWKFTAAMAAGAWIAVYQVNPGRAPRKNS